MGRDGTHEDRVLGLQEDPRGSRQAPGGPEGTVLRHAAIGLLLIGLSACASDVAPLADPGGIEGRVTAGPTCPVETPTQTCLDRPVADARVVAKDPEIDVEEDTTTDAEGTYRLLLRPGTYEVTVEADGMMGGCTPATATVGNGHFETLDLSCDTGIR